MALAAELGRGERVKLCGWDALMAACGAAPAGPRARAGTTGTAGH
jgi:hypothetical protein